jgi:hypothetical protein
MWDRPITPGQMLSRMSYGLGINDPNSGYILVWGKERKSILEPSKGSWLIGVREG